MNQREEDLRQYSMTADVILIAISPVFIAFTPIFQYLWIVLSDLFSLSGQVGKILLIRVGPALSATLFPGVVAFKQQGSQRAVVAGGFVFFMSIVVSF